MKSWIAPPTELRLAPGDVHLWRLPLSVDRSLVPEHLALLSVEERARLDAFEVDVERERFVLRHGALRLILARYLNRDPRSIEFNYAAQGKPELAPGGAEPHLRFNLSHSGDLALLALTWNEGIGVDVEQLRPRLDLERLALESFSPRELAEYRGVADDEKLRAFYNGWTRKEAWRKARGESLISGPRSFEVTLAPGRRPSLVWIENGAEEQRRWSLHALTPLPDYVAAIAVERPRTRLVRIAL